jgi:hypothetical protein
LLEGDDNYSGIVNFKDIPIEASGEFVRNQLITGQIAATKTKETYEKGSELISKQGQKLEALQEKIMKLASSKGGLPEIKTILEHSISLIVNMKATITNMSALSRALVSAVAAISGSAARELSTALQENVEQSPKMAKCRLLDLQRTILHDALVILEGHFSVLRGIAEPYTKLSREYMMPGLQLLNEAAYGGDPRDFQRQLPRLHDFARRSSQGIREAMQQLQEETVEAMASGIEDYQSGASQLTPSKPILDAITAGVDEAGDAAQAALVANVETNALNRFAFV